MDRNTKKKRSYTLAAVFFALFLVLTVLVCTADVQPIGPMKELNAVNGERTQVGLAGLNSSVRDLLDGGRWLTDTLDGGVSYFSQRLYKLTELTGAVSFLVIAVFGLMGLSQLIRRRSLIKVDADILVLGALYIVTLICYVLFSKFVIICRPAVSDLAEWPEASYPSSHTILAIVVYAAAIEQITRRWGTKKWSRIAVFACGVLMAVIVIGRLMSGVHWFTDILGGALMGLTLYFVYAGTVAAVGARS